MLNDYKSLPQHCRTEQVKTKDKKLTPLIFLTLPSPGPSACADGCQWVSVRSTELYYSLEERLGMKKCRQKHGGFWALLTPLGTYGYRYLPLTNRDAMLLTKSFAPLVFAKKFMAFLFSGQSLREKSFLFRLWT